MGRWVDGISQEAITIVSCRDGVSLSTRGRNGGERVDLRYIESWSRTEFDNSSGQVAVNEKQSLSLR